MTRVAPLPAEIYETMTGLDALRAMIAGALPKPPIARTLNFALTEVDNGRAVFAGEPTADVLNPLGSVHGGWAAAILDSARSFPASPADLSARARLSIAGGRWP
ncbi:MAG: phenylacetic acid degradation-like protein [Alphaproteobacteria bacterium]|nr:MAG: phenylacetic acid degradation-like protein [Alphaproteobacteria bacterium]